MGICHDMGFDKTLRRNWWEFVRLYCYCPMGTISGARCLVNSGATDLASRWGAGWLMKQWSFSKVATATLVESIKDRCDWFCYSHMSCVFSTCIWADILFILWFSLIFHCLRAGFICNDNDWRFLVWPPEIVGIVDGSYCSAFLHLYSHLHSKSLADSIYAHVWIL